MKTSAIHELIESKYPWLRNLFLSYAESALWTGVLNADEGEVQYSSDPEDADPWQLEKFYQTRGFLTGTSKTFGEYTLSATEDGTVYGV